MPLWLLGGGICLWVYTLWWASYSTHVKAIVLALNLVFHGASTMRINEHTHWSPQTGEPKHLANPTLWTVWAETEITEFLLRGVRSIGLAFRCVWGAKTTNRLDWHTALNWITVKYNTARAFSLLLYVSFSVRRLQKGTNRSSCITKACTSIYTLQHGCLCVLTVYRERSSVFQSNKPYHEVHTGLYWPVQLGEKGSLITARPTMWAALQHKQRLQFS